MNDLPDDHFAKLEHGIESLLASLSDNGWSAEEISEIRHFLGYGEYGVALETLAGIAVEENYPIRPSMRMAVLKLADQMNMRGSLAIRHFLASTDRASA